MPKKLFQYLVIVLLIFLASMKTTQAKKKIYDTNPKLSEELRKDLNLEVVRWIFGKDPVIEFRVDNQGKLSNLDFIKKTNQNNSSLCFNSLIKLEPFAQQYRDQVHRFVCKPYPDLPRTEFLAIKNYTRQKLEEINKKYNQIGFQNKKC
jgi:hypothetical protein